MSLAACKAEPINSRAICPPSGAPYFAARHYETSRLRYTAGNMWVHFMFIGRLKMTSSFGENGCCYGDGCQGVTLSRCCAGDRYRWLIAYLLVAVSQVSHRITYKDCTSHWPRAKYTVAEKPVLNTSLISWQYHFYVFACSREQHS